MTTSHAAHAKNRATFGGWRAGRPFWGGLFLILSGLELFLSGNMQLALEVHFGPTGFLSYVIPLMMLLCGGLTWLSPQQRLFYGILGTVTALYALIGLNLGGFFLGTVLGLVGGGLAVAWAAPPAAPVAEDQPDPYDDEPPAYQDGRLDDMMSRETEEIEPAPTSGLLTDELPRSQVSPIHEGYGAGSADDQLPPAHGPGDLPKRRHLGPLLMAVALAASIVGAVSHTGEAYAAPSACPSVPQKSAAASSAPATVEAPAATPATSASPTPAAAAATAQQKPGILDWLTGLFTGGKKEATAEQTPTPAPPAPTTAAPAPTAGATTPNKPASTKPAACATASPTPTPNNKKAQLAAGQPFVAKEPSLLKADVMTMDSLTYDGVVDLPHRDGTTVKVLAFTMKNSVSTPFELDTPGASKMLLTKSSKLTVEGDVKFYTTSFSANVLGLLPLTFTPSFPPPPIPLPGFYTDCKVELVYVQSNVLTAPNLSISYAS